MSAPKPMGVRMLSFTSSTRMLPEVIGGGGMGSFERRMSLKVLFPLRKYAFWLFQMTGPGAAVPVSSKIWITYASRPPPQPNTRMLWIV